MRRPTYPLDPLQKVREARVEGATSKLAMAVKAREAAEARRAATEAERGRAQEEARATHASESEALARGELKVADLMRENAWATRVQAEDAARAENVARAAEGEAGAVDDETRAREQLAEKKTDAKLVANDRGRWSVQERKRAEAKEDENAAEAWRKKDG